MKRPAAILAFAVATAGCAPIHPATFAVLPAPDGHIGKIVVYDGRERHLVETAYGAQQLDADGRIHATSLTPAQVKERFGAALAALPPAPATFTLYFLEGRDELTVDSRSELDKVIGEIKRRPLPDILVIGHTDTVGSPDFNDRLSYTRAERARDMLVARGLPAERISVAGRGKRELLVNTEDGISEERNRRVEINVR